MQACIDAELIITFPVGMCSDEELLTELENSREMYQVDPDVQVRINHVYINRPPYDDHGLRVIHADANLLTVLSFDCEYKDVPIILMSHDLTYYSKDGNHYANSFIANAGEENNVKR